MGKWTQNGRAQKLLETLFKAKEIYCGMKPNAVQGKHETFKAFSPAVFRKHWQLTKKAFETQVDGDRLNNDVEYDSYGIDEIDGAKGTISIDSTSEEDEISLNSTFVKPPLHVSTYTDANSKQEKCIVVVLLFGGIVKMDFDIITTHAGQTLRIQYEWPRIMFDNLHLFKDDINLPNFHLLKQVKNNIEDVPERFIEVKLPALLLTQPNTWTKTFKKTKDGNIVLIFEFYVTPKEYTTKK